MTEVHFVVPDGIDDPARPSGGNTYDRRLADGLTAIGWSVREHAIAGSWPRPETDALAALDAALGGIPGGATVLLDGLVASMAPAVLAQHAQRLRLVVLVHMPLADRREGAALSTAAAVVTTSRWGRRRLLELYGLPADGVIVATPGVDAAELVSGSTAGDALLCVGAVTPEKGQDLLLDALGTIADLSWRCECVGRLDRDAAFAQQLRQRPPHDRVSFPGPQTGVDLAQRYATADLIVSPSRTETFGMVVTEALARGLPVVAADVGGLPEALGHGAGGARPGLLVAPEDPAALAAALRAWLEDAALRTRLRHAARERRAKLPAWSATTSTIAGVLTEVS